MMRRDDICLYLSPVDRTELQALVANCNTPRKLAWRAEIVLATTQGHGTFQIMRRAKTSKDMQNAHGKIYVGIDVSKDKLAIAGGERGDEVLSLGTFENTPATVDKLRKKLAGRGDISACYEAGPTGYGLYRQMRAAGCDCCVVAPS